MPNAQSLFDALAGAGGHPVNRAGLDAYVANAQANNALRSAQTEDALAKAQAARDEMTANEGLEGSLAAALGPNRTNEAHMLAQVMRSGHGDAKTAFAALLDAQQFNNRDTLGDVTKLGTPDQTAAQQSIQGKVAEPMALHSEFTTLPGAFKPEVTQTPLGQAQTGAQNAMAGLHEAQAANPSAFHGGAQALDPETSAMVAQFIRQNPKLAGNIRSLVSNGGASVVRAFMQGEAAAPGSPGAPPPPANGVTPDPGVSLAEQAAIRGDFANGLAARQTTALNTMAQHAALFRQIATELQNGNSVPTNALANAWNKAFGSPIPSNLRIAGAFLGREAVRATVNAGAGTGRERELGVTENASPDQLNGAANTLLALAGGQLNSLGLRARRGGVDIHQLLGPEARAAFHYGTPAAPAAPGAAAPPGAPPAAPPAQIPAAAAASLKEGVITQFGNGQKWTLKGGQPVQVP